MPGVVPSPPLKPRRALRSASRAFSARGRRGRDYPDRIAFGPSLPRSVPARIGRVCPCVGPRISSGVCVGAGITVTVRPHVTVSISPLIGVNNGPGTAATFIVHIRVKGVSLGQVLLRIASKALRLGLPLLGLLAEAGSLDLRLLCVRLGTERVGLIFTGLKFRILPLPADFRSVLTVGFIALLPKGLLALAARHEEQNDQGNDDDSNNDPNPGIHRGSTSFHFQHGPATAPKAVLQASDRGRLN